MLIETYRKKYPEYLTFSPDKQCDNSFNLLQETSSITKKSKLSKSGKTLLTGENNQSDCDVSSSITKKSKPNKSNKKPTKISASSLVVNMDESENIVRQLTNYFSKNKDEELWYYKYQTNQLKSLLRSRNEEIPVVIHSVLSNF
ncbi:hypothetical protein OUZ56_032871 [Daphnia magna]|uniref:Uncharacterized protein n=1 Tax=Daphnia magna TaxID=35525 RepID=A0ABR0B9T0_9CRUS|nr:hypothetical protein OUZ56_032871 [Daphnia magna]